MPLLISLIPVSILLTLAYFVFIAASREKENSNLARLGRILGTGILIVTVVLLTTATMITAHHGGEHGCGMICMDDEGEEDEIDGLDRQIDWMHRTMEYMEVRAAMEKRLEHLEKTNPEMAEDVRKHFLGRE